MVLKFTTVISQTFWRYLFVVMKIQSYARLPTVSLIEHMILLL
jgi:hypothetical protein